MGGPDAIRGFQYQFMCVLEYVFSELEKGSSSDVVTAFVESPSNFAGDLSSLDIVDFALLGANGPLLAAQVKSGGAGTTISASELLGQAIALAEGIESDRYLVITNRQATVGSVAVADLLGLELSSSDLIDNLTAQVRRSSSLMAKLSRLDDEVIQRLRRTRVKFDERTAAEVREALRVRIKELRRRAGVGSGTRSSGLLVGYLVSVVLAEAAKKPQEPIPIAEFWSHLSVDQSVLASAWGRRDWGALIGLPPLPGEIERDSELANVRAILQERSSTVRICILMGLSGIGKSSIASIFLHEYAGDYGRIVWVEAGSSAAVRTSIESALESIGFTGERPTTDKLLASTFSESLAALADRWLVVFDNAPSGRDLEPWIPRGGVGDVIVTTTDRLGWHGPMMSTVEVNQMERWQATDLIRLRVANATSTAFDEEKIEQLAAALEYWPLAIELGVNYLLSTGLTMSDVPEYVENLRERSMADEMSVPFGYPRSVVAAIRIVIDRIRHRALSDKVFDLALLLLRYGSYMLPRQIPVDLILYAATTTMAEAVDLKLKGPQEWISSALPRNEILRAMQRDFLAKSDTALDVSRGESRIALSMNEIVQAVLRMDVLDEGGRELRKDIVDQLAFHAQHWVSWLIDNDKLGGADTVIFQTRHVADEALKEGVRGFGLAVLWGNLAIACRYYEWYDTAEKYLRAELSYMLDHPDGRDLLIFQTLTQLAAAITDRPRGMTDNEFSDATVILEKAVGMVAVIDPDLPGLSMTVVSTLQVSERLLRDSRADRRHETLADVLRNYSLMLPPEPEQPVHNSISDLKQLYEDAEYEPLALMATDRLSEMTSASMYYGTVLRLIIESKFILGDCSGTLQAITQAYQAVQVRRMPYLELASALENVGIVLGLTAIETRVIQKDVLDALVDLAEHYEQRVQPFQEPTRSCMLIVSALSKAIVGNTAERDADLSRVAIEHIRRLEPRRARLWEQFASGVARVQGGSAPPSGGRA